MVGNVSYASRSDGGFDTAARLAVEGVWSPWGAQPANDNVPPPARRVSRGAYIATYTGRFYFNDPRPEDFEIEDIAHSLAMTRRYSGHGRNEYTTAEHSVHIYRWLTAQHASPDVRLAGLLHDAPEALSGFGDAASPRKREFPEIGAAEQDIWETAIAPKFGLPSAVPAAVHDADRRICHDEMAQNMGEVDPNVGPPLEIDLEFWDYRRAFAEFLRAFYHVQGVRERLAETEASAADREASAADRLYQARMEGVA